MENLIDNVIDKDYVLKYAKQVTTAILNNDNKKLEELVDTSCEIRDNIEINHGIGRNKEFYYGYLYAYENIASRIVEFNETNENIKQILESNIELLTLVNYLGENGVTRQEYIEEDLNLGPNELENLMGTVDIKKVDIVVQQEVGKRKLYCLNAKGRNYYARGIKS